MQRFTKLMMLVALGLLMTACNPDLRTRILRKPHNAADLEAKGKALLDKAMEKHGSAALSEGVAYTWSGTDTWRGMMGGMGKVWPDKRTDLEMLHVAGTFDAQVHFQSGKRAGEAAGLQSWHYYEGKPGDWVFKKANVRIRFGLAALHYFNELLGRLSHVPVIRYAGQEKVGEVLYDLVFCTWNDPRPHKPDDHYLLYLNASSGMLEYCHYTIRQGYLPGGSMLTGSIRFEDYRDVGGAKIPFRQTLRIGKPSTKAGGWLHRVEMRDFRIDAALLDELHPDPAIGPVGDSK